MTAKNCLCCGMEFNKSSRLSAAQWNRRRYCSKSCKARSTLAEKLFSKIERMPEGCWLWRGSVNQDGYGHIVLDGQTKTAHRVSWTFHNGEIPGDLCVLHRCDVRNCVNPVHLFLGTQGDNNADMDAKGRRRVLRGSACPQSKLNEAVVSALRREDLSKPGRKAERARELGVNKATLANAAAGKTWAHVNNQ